MKRVSIALVGDFNENMPTHRALNQTLHHCAPHLAATLDTPWVATKSLTSPPGDFDGYWITPGSPYENDTAVYDLIQWAREHDKPLLGTCGGFQYMVIEYARNVLGIHDAAHTETDPGASTPVVYEMNCSLKGQHEQVIVSDTSSWLYSVLKAPALTGHFYCRYGVNPAYQAAINKAPFVFTALSPAGEARAVELKGHRFFNGTLFQPTLDSTPAHPNPLVLDFLRRCIP